MKNVTPNIFYVRDGVAILGLGHAHDCYVEGRIVASPWLAAIIKNRCDDYLRFKIEVHSDTVGISELLVHAV